MTQNKQKLTQQNKDEIAAEKAKIAKIAAEEAAEKAKIADEKAKIAKIAAKKAAIIADEKAEIAAENPKTSNIKAAENAKSTAENAKSTAIIAAEKAKKAAMIAVKKAKIADKLNATLANLENENEPIKKVESEDITKLYTIKTDALNYFHAVKYIYNNIKNIDDFYTVISNEIKELAKHNKIINQANIKLVNKEDGKVRYITITAEYLQNKNDFEKRIDDISKGKVSGSDAYDEAESPIAYNVFVLKYFDTSKGYGNSDKIMFEIDDNDIKDGYCAWNCLKKLGFEHNNKKISKLDDLISIIKVNDLKIRVIGNTFEFKDFENIYNRDFDNVVDIENQKTKSITKIKLKKLNDDDIKIVVIYNKCDYQHTIIYDEINKHFEICKNNVATLKNNVFISSDSSIYMGDKKIFTYKNIITNNIKIKNDANFKYVFFDYETVIDFKENSCMKEYSLSILSLTKNELYELYDADTHNDINKVNNIRKSSCKTFLGFDCSKQFINWILENQQDNVFCLVGYNNSNFDNFILLDALLKYKNSLDCEYSINDIFYNGTQLLNFKINGRHHTFDLNKHLSGSLRNNCESFKINCCKKIFFDHNKAQQLYLNDKLIDFITNNQELKEYNEFDVLATAVLFKKYQIAIQQIQPTEKFADNISDFKTIGSLIYNVFENHLSDNNIKLPKISYEQYNDLQKYKIAGRVELFNKILQIFDKIASTDVCSLYPFVMCVLNCYYPCGDSVKNVNTYMGDDVIGFYYCDIDQSNLKANDLPNIYAEKLEFENKWDSSKELKNYLISNVMIGLLKNNGCKVVIKNGFVFENKIKSCEMFKFLLDFMQAKNNQDDLKKKNSLLYVASLREVLKLLMNSLSGKVIEGLHTQKTKAIDSVSEFEKIKNTSQCVNFINDIGGKIFVTYEIDSKKLCEKEQRPIYLGILIYDYAKRYMYEYSYSKIGLKKLLYTDTDATKMRYSDFLDWQKWVNDKNIIVPHWEEVEKYDKRYINHKIYEKDSKVFGSFEDELSDCNGDEYIFYCIQKKSWLYAWKNNGVWDTKFRFKGLNNNSLILTTNEKFLKTKIIKHKKTNERDAYEEKIITIRDNKTNGKIEQEIYNFYITMQDNYIKSNNQIAFFKQIFTTGEAYVLTQSFRKIVKNTKKNVDIDDYQHHNGMLNSIQVNYSLKHIVVDIEKNKK